MIGGEAKVMAGQTPHFTFLRGSWISGRDAAKAGTAVRSRVGCMGHRPEL